MTTKEKAKVIDVVKQMIIDGHISQEVAEKYFPELKESEDEQHRKWILEYLYDGLRKSDEQFKDQFKSAIAWLKEQGQVKESSIPQHENKTCEENSNSLTSEEDERIRKEIKQLIQCMHDADPRKGRWLAWLEKQGKNNMGISEATKQKLEDNLHKVLEKETPESLNKFFDEQGEQKPVISNDALREGIAHFGITQYQIDNWLKKYVDVEKQGEQKQLYIRFGDIPANEKSKIYRGEEEIGTENGVSVYPAFKTDEGDIVLGLNLPITKTTLHTQQHLIEYDNRPCYLVKGNYVGKDTDGQPLINNVSIIEKIGSYRAKEEKQGEQKPTDSYCRENCKGFQETGKCFADGDCKAKREAVESIDKVDKIE